MVALSTGRNTAHQTAVALHHALLTDGQGCTLDFATLTPIARTDGFVVAVPGAELRTTGIPSITLIEQWVREYAEPIAILHEAQGHHCCLGAWVDKGQCYLDVSTVIDDEDAAVAAGRQWRQLAIYDLKRGEALLIAA